MADVAIVGAGNMDHAIASVVGKGGSRGGFAMGVAVFVLWMVNFGISASFSVLATSVGPTWTFLLFVLLGVLAITFISTSMPETKGRSLEALEHGFRARYSS